MGWKKFMNEYLYFLEEFMLYMNSRALEKELITAVERLR